MWLWVSGFPIDGRVMLDALKSFSTWKWTAPKMPMKMTRTESSTAKSSKALMCLISIKFMGSLYSPSSPDFRKALATFYHCLLFLDSESPTAQCRLLFSLLACSGSLSLSLRWPCTTATLWAVASFLLRVLPTKQFGTIIYDNTQCTVPP